MTYPQVETMRAYEEAAQKFAKYRPGRGVVYNSLKLSSEAGEVAGKIAKELGHGKDYDLADMMHELGDCLWHLTMLAGELGFTLEDVANANLIKLAGREERGTIVGDGDVR